MQMSNFDFLRLSKISGIYCCRALALHASATTWTEKSSKKNVHVQHQEFQLLAPLEDFLSTRLPSPVTVAAVLEVKIFFGKNFQKRKNPENVEILRKSPPLELCIQTTLSMS